MQENIERMFEMSATERMSFVKECCSGNEEVSKMIVRYEGCILKWLREIDEYIIFTVCAGNMNGIYVSNPNEYITVSFNTETGDVFCLEHYLHNYSGYSIYVEQDLSGIKQEIGHGFGSWTYNELNFDLTNKASRSEQNHGSCCD